AKVADGGPSVTIQRCKGRPSNSRPSFMASGARRRRQENVGKFPGASGQAGRWFLGALKGKRVDRAGFDPGDVDLLLVDDDATLRDEFERYFTRCGYRAVCCESGAD